jgi:PAS domain S-box-containing protein
MGYDPLLSDVLGVRLSKSASFTKWDRRPLTDEQLRYAREDVLHLQQLAVALQEELAGSSAWSGRARSAGRWRASPTSATRTSSSCACRASAGSSRRSAPSRASSSSGARRPRGARTSRPRRPARRAAHRDRAPAPQDIERLQQIRGLNEGVLRRRGASIVAAVERGREPRADPRDGERPDRRRSARRPRRSRCARRSSARAPEGGLAYELVASRADIERIVRAQRTARTSPPSARWRAGARRARRRRAARAALRARRALRLGATRSPRLWRSPISRARREGPRPSAFEGLLAEAGRVLASSLQLEDTLRSITRLAVPELADWSVVDVFTADGTLEQLSSGHPDPAKDELLLTLRHRWREQPTVDSPPGALSVLHAGEPAIFEPLAREQLPPMTAEELRLWDELGAVSWLIVPLQADGADPVGVMTFLSTDPGRVYGERDVPVALELAERCAQAVRNAQVYEEAESSRALLDTILATAPVGLCVLDAGLRFLLINERMAAINGLPVEAHIGHSFHAVFGSDGAEPQAIMQRVLDTGLPVTDVELVFGDRAFFASYAPVQVDGRTIGVICAVIETTERHHAQAAVGRLLDRTRGCSRCPSSSLPR